MPKTPVKKPKLEWDAIKKLPGNYWRRGWWQKSVVIFWLLVLAVGTIMYCMGQWYIRSEANKPLKLGVSFVPAYAESLGLDAQETMDGLIDIGARHYRLVSYWNQLEGERDKYDFSQLDWQFRKAEAADAKVTLAIGLRQPRWPECHMPDWAKPLPDKEWQSELDAYIKAVVQRYKKSPALDSYQLENEYFNTAFGLCTNFDRGRLIREFNIVKRTDNKHPVIISRSNNALGIPWNEPKPDIYGVSVYKRVWDAGASKRYIEYPFPDWFYGFLAQWQRLNDGRNMIVHEMQAEAWAPDGKSLTEISLDEQNKSLNAKRLEDRFGYAKGTGMREIYMWGGEYWYWRLTKQDDPSLWNVAREEFSADK